MSTLGDRIKQLRKENNLTQKEIGEKLNLAKSTVSQYENNINTPDIDIIKKLANIFDVSIDYLLGTTDIRNYQKKKATSLSEALLDMLFEQGYIKDKEDLDEKGLEVIKSTIDIYLKQTNNKKDAD